MIDQLMLLSGADIPFIEGRAIVHQPSLKEIAAIGENNFFQGVGFLDFSKKLLDSSDKIKFENYDDFDIFMSIVISRSSKIQKHIDNAFSVLFLIFPLYQIEVRNNQILLIKENEEGFIDKTNFSAFKEILCQIFGLAASSDSKYNPQDALAKKIADKFKEREQQLAKLAGKSKSGGEIDILSRYSSILAIGSELPLLDLMQYTVYQLYDSFQRYQLKIQWDAYLQAKMAGAKNLNEVDHWMINLKEIKNNK